MDGDAVKVFYTYMWLREDGTPYYVGKGNGNRAFDYHKRPGNPPPRDRILIQEFPCEEDAYAAERFLIEYYGRKKDGSGVLWNLTDGGTGGPRGEFRTAEHADNLRRAIIERNKKYITEKPDNWYEIMMKGFRNMSDESRKRMREGPFKRRPLKGIPKPWTDERRIKNKQRHMSMTHCKHGHEYTDLYIHPTTGARSCRACKRIGDRRRSPR